MPTDRDPIVRRPEAAAVEAALGSVPGIASVSISESPDGVLGLLRVVLEPDADEVDVAAAAHRILRLQFGVGLDPDRIEVIEVSSAESSVPAPRLRLVEETSTHTILLDPELTDLIARLDAQGLAGPRFHTDVLSSVARHPAGSSSVGTAVSALRATPAAETNAHRLAIARLALSADGLGVSATVTLARGPIEHAGQAEGASSGTSVLRTVALATARAISSALGAEHRIDVDAVSVAPVGSEHVAVVQVEWVTVEGSERLTGSSEVRDDVRQAVIRATLDAVNRRLAPVLDR